MQLVLRTLTTVTPHPFARDLGLLILRVALGGFMIFGHGLRKLTNFEQLRSTFQDPLGVGSEMSVLLVIFAEVFCSAAIVLGLGTRIAAVPLIVTMVVITTIVKAGTPFGERELALMYMAGYWLLLLLGPGRISLDALIRPGRR